LKFVELELTELLCELDETELLLELREELLNDEFELLLVDELELEYAKHA